MSRRLPMPAVARAQIAWVIGLAAAAVAGLAVLVWALSTELAAPAPAGRGASRAVPPPAPPPESHAAPDAVAGEACEHPARFGPDAAADELAQHLARREWTAAAAVVASFSNPEDRLTAWPLLLEAWAEFQPATALDFVQTRLADLERRTALAAVVTGWAARDLPSAAAWLSEQPARPENDAVFAAVAEHPALAAAEPAQTLACVEKITDCRLRWEATRSVVQRWAQHDESAARDYAARLTDLTSAQRALLLRRVAQRTALLD